MTKCQRFLWVAALGICGFPGSTQAGIDLGTSANFAILAGSSVTNIGDTIVGGGDVGVSSGSITGFPSGTLMAPYTFHASDPLAAAAQVDLTTAYGVAASLAPTQILTGQDLGGLRLTPGVYFFASSAQLTGTLTLDDQGDPTAQFVFQIGSTLTTATGSSVLMTDGGSNLGGNVFWQVGSSATIGTGSAIEGHLLAMTSISLATGATIQDGSALAINGAVTLNDNLVTNISGTVPEPASAALCVIGGVFGILAWGRARLVRT